MSSLKPDIVLITKVKIPDKSILLSSRVCTIEGDSTPCSGVSFGWRGSLDNVEHTALLGAADLLRHVSTSGSPPLSGRQHFQVARNLLRRYEDFLSVQGDQYSGLKSDVNLAAKGEKDVSDSDLSEFLSRFDTTEALKADAERADAARNASLVKLGLSR